MTFARYLLIQILAYAIDFGWFIAATKSGLLLPVAANAIGKLTAGLFAFAAHRYFTFRVSDEGNGRAQAIKYFSLLGFNIPFASVVLWVGLRFFSHDIEAKVFADAILVISNFWISKHFVFVSAGSAGAPKDEASS